MSTLFKRLTAIIPIVAAASLAGKENFFYKRDGANKAVVIAAATDIPDGLILSVTPSGLEISAAPCGGNHGTVGIKLGADVTDLRLDLQLRADGTVGPDTGAGARVVVARPLETGVTDEIIECVLLKPRAYGAAVMLASTNGTAAAAADLAALKVEAENIGDDVRAIWAALQAGKLLG